MLASTSPCLIREVFYAPPCPVEVAQLFEVGLAQHNSGELENAINTYLAAQTKWEELLLREKYTDLDDPDEKSMLATLIRREKRMLQEAEVLNDGMLVAEARRDVERGIALEREAEDRAAALAQAAALAGDDTMEVPKRYPPSGGGEGVDHDKTELYTKADLKKFEEIEQLHARALDEAKAAERAATEDRQRRKMQAMYECPALIPSEAHIFLQLAIGSVLQSATADERALRCFLHALELCHAHLGAGRPTRHPVTATVHSCLGSVYFHIAQYDFAGDHFFKALEIREHILPEGHVDIAATLNNIACTLTMLSRPSDALVFFYRASEMLECQLDEVHPRRDAVEHNIRKIKRAALCSDVPPPVPFQRGVVPPRIPGAQRAKDFLKPKAKKSKSKDDKKKK